MTMKVLTMQLYSITTMDIVAFGGAAVGILLAGIEYQHGEISLMGCLTIILLSAEFFNPIRLLGSYFHVAMNGIAASKKIFDILAIEERSEKTGQIVTDPDEITCYGLTYRYAGGKEALRGVNLHFCRGGYIAIVGRSGSGKSTAASLLSGANTGYQGSIRIGGSELSEVREESLMRAVTIVSSQSYLFSGTVRGNLLLAKPDASEAEMSRALEAVCLSDFLKQQNGLDTALTENGSNFSGGQRQRLAMARAMLHDSPVYIFDEATSNIDAESEDAIMTVVRELAKDKLVILITHRLENAVGAQRIYVLDDGRVDASGTHMELLRKSRTYAELYNTQKALEMM
jgi:ABC-type transport system involved in cytochrome bd biosynthesis fused ATPase/permease subunit